MDKLQHTLIDSDFNRGPPLGQAPDINRARVYARFQDTCCLSSLRHCLVEFAPTDHHHDDEHVDKLQHTLIDSDFNRGPPLGQAPDINRARVYARLQDTCYLSNLRHCLFDLRRQITTMTSTRTSSNTLSSTVTSSEDRRKNLISNGGSTHDFRTCVACHFCVLESLLLGSAVNRSPPRACCQAPAHPHRQ